MGVAGSRRAAGCVLAEVTVRPQVPMGAFQALGYVCAMGAVEGLREAGIGFAAIGWPQDVVDARTFRPLCTLKMHAGYDKGMYASCTVVGAQQVGLLRELSDEQLSQALTAGITGRVALWEEQIVAGAGVAGPLAPVLSEYFDLVALLGHPAVAVYPNGNEIARGTFAGVDIWGRATLLTEDGRELELSPEQGGIRPA
ncbi:MAG: hypothetical protein IKG11_08865 [Atopobiaceae bacterium]|nr:hypothetical protein [Atopobiaceae bacterium]